MIYESGLLLGDFIDLWKLLGLIYSVRRTGGWSNLLYLLSNGSCLESLRHKHVEGQRRGREQKLGEKSKMMRIVPSHFPLCLACLFRAGEALLPAVARCRARHTKGKHPLGVGILSRSGRGPACGICLTGVIESVLNYYSNWRACLTVELPVKQVGRKPRPVKARQSKETRGVGLMDFSTASVCGPSKAGAG